MGGSSIQPVGRLSHTDPSSHTTRTSSPRRIAEIGRRTRVNPAAGGGTERQPRSEGFWEAGVAGSGGLAVVGGVPAGGSLRGGVGC